VASVLAARQEEGVAANAMLRLGLAIFFTMNVMVFTMALWSEDIYPAKSFANPLAETLRSVFRWASLMFSLPVLYLLGGPIAQGVWQSLQRRVLTTDLLILAGVIAAYCYSLVSVLRGAGHVYFEIGAMVMVFVSIGRWLEAKGKHRAGTSLDRLIQMLPEKARQRQADGQFCEIPTAELHTGDIVRILPGERFPVDGLITRGQAMLDEQIVTGESVQTIKTVGDAVYSGTLNLDGDLWIEVTATDGQETLSRIIEMVRAARSVKGRHERLADRIALVFIPLVCIIALGTLWWHYRHSGLNQGILTSLSVVLIACPCALGMATPMAIWAALGRAAQGGLLFRSGVVLERLAGIRVVCFDKTGTLTTGRPAVANFFVENSHQLDEVLTVANTLASGSNHLLSQAIVAYATRTRACESLASKPVQIAPGQGVWCDVDEIGVAYLGSRQYLAEQGLTLPRNFAGEAQQRAAHHQEVCVGWSGKIRGLFLFREALRTETEQALLNCRKLGLEMRLLSGDHRLRAIPLGDQFGIESEGNLLPADKAETLKSLKKFGPVAMVGDGLNDAPALATADVGVALGCGADVSRDAAGVCLLSNDLRRFPWSVALARQTLRIVKQNLFWAFAYNVIGIGLAACGRLNPILAALAMALSSVFVIFNSLRLSRYPEPSPMLSDDDAQVAEPLPVANLDEPSSPELVGAGI
jgi:heavy metal translocating P-type ATPase